MADDLMAEAERLLNDPSVPHDPAKHKLTLELLRDRPEVLPHFIESMKRKIKEAANG